MTVDELMARVVLRMGATAPGGQGTFTLDEIRDATCWFIAVYEARGFLDAWKTKDVAAMIVDACPIGGPFKEVEHITDWLDYHQDEDDEWWDIELDRHFGIKR